MEQETISLFEIDFNKDPSIIYVDRRNSKGLALNLLIFGLGTFANALRVKEFNEYKSLNVPRHELDINKATPFIYENMIDIFKIITCFENYMKAKLLLNGNVVHVIKNDEKYKHLYNKQRKMPVTVREVTMIENFIIRPKEKIKALLPGIINMTIGIGTMLNSRRYQQVIQLPETILKTIKGLNEYRNNHHFYVNEVLSMSDGIVNDLSELIEFTKGNEMLGLFKQLDSERITFESAS